jgi:hypothetical protein
MVIRDNIYACLSRTLTWFGNNIGDAHVCFMLNCWQGSDCIEPFLIMQECMNTNSDKFTRKVAAGGEDEESRGKVKGQQPESEPPVVPERAIRLPLYMKEKTA